MNDPTEYRPNSAFPHGRSDGMLKRDYFAIHTQLDREHVVAAAGHQPYFDGGKLHVIKSRFNGPILFGNWWASLSAEERIQIEVRARYALADAMVAHSEALFN